MTPEAWGVNIAAIVAGLAAALEANRARRSTCTNPTSTDVSAQLTIMQTSLNALTQRLDQHIAQCDRAARRR
jgi:uncharacterized membrane-anchored protein YhcB (DUF1043 family)